MFKDNIQINCLLDAYFLFLPLLAHLTSSWCSRKNAWDVGTFKLLSCTTAGELRARLEHASTPRPLENKAKIERKFQYPLIMNVLRGHQYSKQKWNVIALTGHNVLCFKENILYILKYIGV